MIPRLVVALLLIALALCGYLSLVHWQEDPHPLVIEAAATVPTPAPGETPTAIPDPFALYAPCPTTPRNVFPLSKRDA